ncbi:MAG: PqqD family protein [Planctomycetota bacterium]
MSNVVPHVYEVNAPDVVSEAFDAQVVIINLATGHYYSLGGIAGSLWSLLGAGHSTQAIVESLQAQRPQLIEPVSAFITQLHSLGLIRPAGGPAVSTPIDVVWADEPPWLEVFEDLAELIASDPVHDVDMEAGWPVIRSQP